MEQGYLRKSHAHRKDLTGEHPFGDKGQLILLVIFLIIWVFDSFIFKYSTFLADNFSLYIRILLAVLVLIPSGYFAYSAHKIVFGQKSETPKVITAGVFSIVRHPMYLGAILLYLGLTIITMSLFSALVWLITIIFYYKISKFEEKLLVNRFGQEYLEYKKRVPMFLPTKLKFNSK